eukprot:TRINITY_DN44462_c0_g1_i1.p1 TRINITY_DN44462_c0_g1~~TRINITY_DN44462_c0_g1_i1.p1  ORF type:complete len:376 (+),score=48.51 TRINITY_DN44462_c0_g1_i1:28-1128(+)
MEGVGAMGKLATACTSMMVDSTESLRPSFTQPHQRSWRWIAWQFFENSQQAPVWIQRASMIYELFTGTMIIVMFIIDGIKMGVTTDRVFNWLQLIVAIIFIVEYLLRLYSCVEEECNYGARSNCCVQRWRFALRGHMLIDLFAMTTLVFDRFLVKDNYLRGIVTLRMLRIFTLFHLEHTAHFFASVGKVVVLKRKELLGTLGGAGLLLLISSTILFYVENDHNPAFSSMMDAMWWGTATLTTVGYGDIVPTTMTGRIVGGVVAFIGIGVFGLPAAILASGFEEQRRKEASRVLALSSVNCSTHQERATASFGATEPANTSSRLDALQTDITSHFESVSGELAAISGELAALRQQQAEILLLLKNRS